MKRKLTTKIASPASPAEPSVAELRAALKWALSEGVVAVIGPRFPGGIGFRDAEIQFNVTPPAELQHALRSVCREYRRELEASNAG